MMETFGLLRIIIVIISINFARSVALPEDADQGSDQCADQTTYCLDDQQSLEVKIYYDAGFLDPDTGYLESMCDSRKEFTKVTFTFLVGLDLLKDDQGNLLCPNFFGGTDCTDAYTDACASQLLPNFGDYVCCNYLAEEETSEACFQKQNSDTNALNNCVSLADPNIKPADILWCNSQAGIAVDPNDKNVPILEFNGQRDVCARANFLNTPHDVICAMLATGVDSACN